LALSLWLILLAALRPLAIPDEGRYAEVGRWMLASGDWLAPRLDGMPFFHKPPLLHWLQASSFWVFGVTPWAARLVPAAHATVMMVAVYATVLRMGQPVLALRAAVVLGTSMAFLIGGQYVNHDMMVATWIGVAIWSFAASLMHGERPHANLARLGFAACALGVLSKGLIGLALPGLVLVIWVAWTRQFGKVWRLPWFSGVLIFSGLALPWFFAAQHSYPGLFDYLFGNQQFARYTASGFNNVHPWWFYGLALAVLMLPWTPITAWTAVAHWRRNHQSTAPASTKPAAESEPKPTPSAQQALTVPVAPEWVALCWIWLIAIMVFFSVPASKLVGYMLPVVPPVAVLMAMSWNAALGEHRTRAFSLAAVTAAVLGLALTWFSGQYTLQKSSQALAQTLACAASPGDEIFVTGRYPYDLPFYAQTSQALRVVADWPQLRKNAGDDWRRELFESADFDPVAGQVLQSLKELQAAASLPGRWLVTSDDLTEAAPYTQGWQRVTTQGMWTLWAAQPNSPASVASAAERPQPAEHKGLPGCHQ
jgi:4-amino-4-deoxy-L-arabinose transferase-like glycosyltransferase